jgi:hypothetical protein
MSRILNCTTVSLCVRVQFCKLFEPTIVRRASSAGTMDIEELMKEVRSTYTPLSCAHAATEPWLT